MNFGYAIPGNETLSLASADEPDRYCIQLYNHVAGEVDLGGCTVLEVGSGRGGGSSFLRRYKRPAVMVGVDLSQKAVDFSRLSHHEDGLEFKVGDAESLPFTDNSFDAVINVESSHCYPAFETFLSEVRRVLRPGGHFLYADFRERSSIDAWRSALQAAGLEKLRETDITPNVVMALESDNDRKVEWVHRNIPAIIRPSFLNFAAVRGSDLFESFRSGRLVYMSFVFRK